MTLPREIGVIGAGAWGTALAMVACRSGGRVVLWARRPEAAEAMRAHRENVDRLPGSKLPANLEITSDPSRLATADAWIVASPAQEMRAMLALFAEFAGTARPIVITAKGIERTSGLFMSAVLEQVLPTAVPLVLSGPSFAGDVARGLPTAVTLAAPTLDAARPVAEALQHATFRPYLSDDMIGVQVGGAIKNVLAIAAGIVIGRGLGESARAALVARAFAELSRYGRSMGARAETMAGLSGLGDLLLTSTSAQSRNFQLGVALGSGGRSASDVAHRISGVTEGAYTAEIAVSHALRHGLEVPIIAAVAEIVAGRVSIDAAIDSLMQRPIKVEDA